MMPTNDEMTATLPPLLGDNLRYPASLSNRVTASVASVALPVVHSAMATNLSSFTPRNCCTGWHATCDNISLRLPPVAI